MLEARPSRRGLPGGAAIVAGAALASVPVLILFAVVQRDVIAGVARPGLQG